MVCNKSSNLNIKWNSTNNLLANYSPTLTPKKQTSLQATGIVDSGTTDIYLSADAPILNIDRAATKVTVGTATGQTQVSICTGELNLPKLPANFPVPRHILPGFRPTLLGVGPLCDADCKVTFTSTAVVVRDPQGNPVLTGWREQSGPRLWIIALHPDDTTLPSIPYGSNKTTLQAYSAYDLPSVAALIHYFHAAAGYPVRSTWLKAIVSGNYYM